jgi:hypothetical protein
MRKKLPTIVALVCILIYVAAVLFAAYRVYISVQQQQRVAEQELDRVREFLSQNGPSFLDAANRAKLQERTAASKTIEGIIITGSFGSELTFEREQGRVVSSEGGPHSFKSGFGLINLPARQVTIEGLRNVNIYAVSNIIDYPYFILILKQTLLAVLAALALSFITLILEAVLGKSSGAEARELPRDSVSGESSESVDYGEDSNEDFSTGDGDAGEDFSTREDDDEIDESFFDDVDAASNDEKQSSSFESNDDSTEDDGDLGDFEFTDLSSGDSGSENEPAADESNFDLDDFLDEEELELPAGESLGLPEDDLDEPVDNYDFTDDSEVRDVTEKPSTGSGPKGLYSPHGNIGWEEYTQDRLASEIHRCAASEQDLVVLLLECGETVDCTEDLFNKLASEAVQFFNLKDLTFVKGGKGISVIIPNADLDHGIRKAEEFHARIMGAYRDDFSSKGDLLVGISSRSGRLIDAERLLFEASNALAKAGPQTPIVAFKSDPEKYRDFIRKGSAG